MSTQHPMIRRWMVLLGVLTVFPWPAAKAQSSLPDRFAEAQLITNVTWTVSTQISTNFASAEPGEPDHAGSPARASQWIRLRYPEDGFVAISLGSLPDQFRFAVYTGDDLDSLVETASVRVGRNSRSFGWEVQAGVTYRLALDIPDTPGPGPIQTVRGRFHRQFLRPEIQPLPRQSPVEVTLNAVNLNPDEEFQEISFMINSSPVLTRTAPPWSLTVTNQGGGTVWVTARARTNLRLPFDLASFEFRLLPPNDDWEEATLVSSAEVDWTQIGNTEFATAEPGEPEYSPGVPVVSSVWWRWTPAFTGWTRASVPFGTLQWFQGDTLSGLTPLLEDPGRGFVARSGTPYAFRLALPPNGQSYNAAVTLRRIVLALEPPPGVLIETNASGGLEMHITADEAHTFSVSETNPADGFASLQLERRDEENWATWEVISSATASPRQFTLTLPPGGFSVVRVSGGNQQGSLRTSDPVAVIAAPAHDRFDRAIELPALGLANWDWTGVSLAGREADEPNHGHSGDGGSLWYRWTPATSGTGVIQIPAVGGLTTVAVYLGESLNSLQFVTGKTAEGFGGDSRELPVPVTAGLTYRIAVVGADPAQAATLQMVPVRVDSVANELHQGNAVTLRAEQFGGTTAAEVVWSLNGTTLVALSPAPTASYSWIPTSPGPLLLRATATIEGAQVTLLDVSGWIRPSNDRREYAAPVVPVEGLPGFSSATGTLTAATRELAESSSFSEGYGTVWHLWTAPSGKLRARQVSGGPPIRLEIFFMGAGGVLTSVTSFIDLTQAVDLPVAEGTTYHLAISGGAPGASDFTLYLGPAPANDDFVHAQPLIVPATGGSVALSSANVLATAEPIEASLPALALFQRYGNLWWKFTAEELGGALFHLVGSPVPNTAAVFTGTALTNLQLLVGPEAAGENPVAWVPFSVQPGVTYWIAAGGNPNREESLGPVAGSFDFVIAPELLRITRQPVGEAVVLGQYLVLDVLASGVPPFEYEWYRNGQRIPDASERQLIFGAVQAADLGIYEVIVRSGDQSVTSLPAVLTAAPQAAGGGVTRFEAWGDGPEPFLVRVTDTDGVSLLEGENFVAQLYVGATLNNLRPVGAPSPFLTDALAGFWAPQVITLPQIAPGTTFHAQVRAWDRVFGASYEEARALGGRFGRSEPTTAVADDPAASTNAIATFRSFSLRSGHPGFTAGRIESVRVDPDGSAVWRLTGAAGFRYLLERQTDGAHWTPVEVYPQFSGATTFTTPATSTSHILYRARVLD